MRFSVGLKWMFREADKLRAQGINIMTVNILGRVYTIPLNGEAMKVRYLLLGP